MLIVEWKSKLLSDESIKPPTTSNNSLAPLIDNYSYKIRLKFNGSCLTQPKVTYTHEKVVNIYIVYELAGSSSLWWSYTKKLFIWYSYIIQKIWCR